MTEKRRAPLEVLERLAEAVDAWSGCTPGPTGPRGERVAIALAAYRAATAPLRTRAEVDAEIVRTVRSCGEGWWKSRGIESVAILVGEDCSEPTTDEPEPEPEPERISDRRCRRCGGLFATPVERLSHEGACANATTDHDADLRDPEPCSCEEAEALRERLVAIRKVCESFTCSVCAVDVLAILGPP